MVQKVGFRLALVVSWPITLFGCGEAKSSAGAPPAVDSIAYAPAPAPAADTIVLDTQPPVGDEVAAPAPVPTLSPPPVYAEEPPAKPAPEPPPMKAARPPAMAAPSPPDAPKPAKRNGPVEGEDYSTVKIFYGTNRNNTGNTDPAKEYGSNQGPLELGVLRVTIPLDAGRKAGDIPRPHIYNLQFHEDVAKHVVLGAVTKLSKEQWLSEFRGAVDTTADRAVLVFIHGFNVNFREAAWRAGQLAYDLGFDGATALYSWPSKDKVQAYTVDQTTAAQSSPELADFLELVVHQTGALRVHLIAHSMGNLVLTQALDEMARREEQASLAALRAPDGGGDSAAPPAEHLPWFNHIVLAAPDVDARIFAEQVFPRIRGTAQDWTLYASARDLALGASSELAGHGRLGVIEDGQPSLIEGVTTVDASLVKGDFFGHGYFAEVLPLLTDMHELISLNVEPARRNVLRAQGQFWVLRWGE